MARKVVIVGGVAGGASTAARLRRLNEDWEIVMFEKGEYVSFANCGLPYHIGGTIKDRARLIVLSAADMAARFNIDIRVLQEVTGIDRAAKRVEVKNLKTRETYQESYDFLVLSPGAKPVRPPIPGSENAANLFTLRNIPDTDAIKGFIDENRPQQAVVVGGGFIGLEMAENLQQRGIRVTLVEMADQVMAPLDYEMACIVHDHLLDKNVELILEDGVRSFAGNGRTVVLNSGREVAADMIVLAIGVQPETSIAREAGLAVNNRHAIIVDSRMQTSDPYIYALGDAVEVTDYITGKPAMVPLAWPANRQGRIVADNLSGRDVGYPGTLGSSVAKVFDLTVASTGNNEKALKGSGMDYRVLHIHPGSHAGYYPGAFPMSLKLLFTGEGRILGAQGVGFAGVDKRIDILATAIKGGLKVFDLPDLELCYAPPYSSAKDPVNMAGYVAANILEGLVETVQWHEVDEIIRSGGFLLDVREPFEAELGVLGNSVNIPLGQLRHRLHELPKGQVIYVYCQVGLRGYVACRILAQSGYECKNIDGGFKTYGLVKGINGDKGAKIWHGTQDTGVSEAIAADAVKPAAARLDACGLQCPGPIRMVFETMAKLREGDTLEVCATDPGFKRDIAAWCEKTGNLLLKGEYDRENKQFVVLIRKGNSRPAGDSGPTNAGGVKQGATLVVFSGDLDKAIASFIIATGAASLGKQVTMFFTFWGLNVIKKKDKPLVVKDTVAKMFDMMLPGHAGSLPLSKMHMGGMGPRMIKYIMRKNNVDDIETLIQNALHMGVKVVACSMSMDLMGIRKEEFIDGVEIGGVASYLAATEDAGLNLFV